MRRWSVTILERDYRVLYEHLFRADRDEHAAFLYAGVVHTDDGSRLLARRVVPVPDRDFVPSDRGAYRQIVPRTVARAAIECDQAGLCLLWAHSHPGADRSVGFSADDLGAHRYAHPALLDITHGRPVASLVLGENSAAGEVWTRDEPPADLGRLRVVGNGLTSLSPTPGNPQQLESRFARQILMFGLGGQQVLRDMTVAIVGAGGGGSLLIEMLAHLGVGRLIIVDPDTIDETNLSRVVGAQATDIGRFKVDVARDHVRRIDSSIRVEAFPGDVVYSDDARRLRHADFAFLATDTILSRYAFNLLCHQFLVPGIQVGAKVTGNSKGGIELIHVMNRPVTLQEACLDCAGAIPADRLAREQSSPSERRAQAYVDGGRDAEAIEEPSVITLNAISASLAATDFLFMATGVTTAGTRLDHTAYYPQERALRTRTTTKHPACRFCGDEHTSALARGDLKSLALRPGTRIRAQVPTPTSRAAARSWRPWTRRRRV
jgi:molybdopterin/thiamine biosynthesis adenylyltransferase